MPRAAVVKARQRNPIVPRNPEDRTGTGGIRRRAEAEIRRRWAGLQVDILALFERIPVYQMNDLRSPEVRYGLRPEDLAGIAEELQATLDRWLTDGRDPSHILWWEPYAQAAQQLGTAQAVANLTALSTAYAAARNLGAVVYSEPYRLRARLAKFRSYEHWTGLASEQRTRLSQVIGQAVADGTNPRVARKAIQEALGIGKARALLYAQTDILNTLREARREEAAQAEQELGIKTALLWTSALKATTRHWHAARHGRTYTREDVTEFYAQGGNRYNCYCAQTEALLDESGKPILTKKLQSSMANEKKAWQSGHKG